MFLAYFDVNPFFRFDAFYQHIFTKNKILPHIIGRHNAISEEYGLFRTSLFA